MENKCIVFERPLTLLQNQFLKSFNFNILSIYFYNLHSSSIRCAHDPCVRPEHALVFINAIKLDTNRRRFGRSVSEMKAVRHTWGMAQKLKTLWLRRRDRYAMTSGTWRRASVTSRLRQDRAELRCWGWAKSSRRDANWLQACRNNQQ